MFVGGDCREEAKCEGIRLTIQLNKKLVVSISLGLMKPVLTKLKGDEYNKKLEVSFLWS
jgi:hypothetical protein